MIQDGREENPQVASASGGSDSGAKSSSRSGFGIERKAVLVLVVGHLDRCGSAKSKSLKSIEVRISDESKNRQGRALWIDTGLFTGRTPSRSDLRRVSGQSRD
jgi:hypothetical protein